MRFRVTNLNATGRQTDRQADRQMDGRMDTDSDISRPGPSARGEITNTYLHEPSPQVIISDIKDCWVKDGSGVVDLLDYQAIGKGRDLQHVKQSRLRGSNLLPSMNQFHITLKTNIGKSTSFCQFNVYPWFSIS